VQDNGEGAFAMTRREQAAVKAEVQALVQRVRPQIQEIVKGDVLQVIEEAKAKLKISLTETVFWDECFKTASCYQPWQTDDFKGQAQKCVDFANEALAERRKVFPQ
jgi:hypothetical protein